MAGCAPNKQSCMLPSLACKQLLLLLLLLGNPA
jgi:hypothetical protein